MFELVLSAYVMFNGQFTYETYTLDTGLTYEDCVHAVQFGDIDMGHMEHSDAYVECVKTEDSE